MTTLYTLSSQMIALQKMMEDDESPMDSETLAATLDGLNGDIEAKATSLLGYVSNLSADVDAIDMEIKRLNARTKTIKNRQDSLREYLRLNMEAGGIDKITCPLFTITLRKAAKSVHIDDQSLIPAEYLKTVVTPVKMDIARALKAGDDVPGASLVSGTRGLIIK